MRHKESTALVVVLAFMTILTLVLLAYINLMMVDRQATRNYAQGLKADEMSRGAMDFIIGQLRAEMANGTTPASAGNFYIYTNVTSANIKPGTIATNVAMPSLIKMSTNGLGVFAAAAPTNIAVNAVTSTGSVNGRSVNIGRWSKPGLGTLTAAPSWYLVGATGITNAPSSAVQGRFAYTIYDVGSLVDINVAGFPSSLNPAQKNSLRDSLAGLDISTLPGMSQSTSDALIQNFRNRTSSQSATSYTNQMMNVAPTNGFMVVSPGDDTFLGRQDLLAYAKAYGLGSVTTNFTTFTRTLNSPGWAPNTSAGSFTVQTMTRSSIVNMNSLTASAASQSSTTADYNYQANALTSSAVNRNVLSQVVTIPFTRFDGTTAVVGEPLVTERFPLDRLGWLSYQGPSTLAVAKFGSTAAAQTKIKQAFGLVWDPVNLLWVYTSPNSANSGGSYAGGSSSNGPASSGLAASTIKTLNVVASEGREPDFFELLNAGILRGSLGVRSSINGQEYTLQPGEITPEGQVFQIGANIIDQYDTDDYPTLIRAYMPVVMRNVDANTLYYVYGKGPAALTPYDFAGVENVPYLSQLRLRVYRPEISQGNLAGRPYIQGTLMPQFWNPHQNAGNPSATHPGKFRLIQTFGSIRVNTQNYSPANYKAGDPSNTGFNSANDSQTSPPSEWPSSELATPLPQPEIDFSGSLTFANPGFLKPANVSYTSVPQDIRPALTPDQDQGGFVGFWLGQTAISGPDNTPWDINVWKKSGQTAATFPPTDPNQTCTLSMNSVYNQVTPLPATDPFWKGDTVSAANFNLRYPTFELQYQDGSVWKTYQRFDGVDAVLIKNPDADPTYPSFTGEFHELITGRIDPRGSRLGLMVILDTPGVTTMTGVESATTPPYAYYTTPIANSWQSRGPAGDAMMTETAGGPLPGNQSGAIFTTEFNPTNYNAYYQYWQFMYNVANSGGDLNYYSDNDQVIRRGDNRISPTTANPLIPSATAQPIMLNRPFTSVADLGYVFRDLPFKTLDLFSAGSADAGLLDLFSIHQGPAVIAGKVNLNTNNTTLLAQLLTGGVKTELDGGTLSATEGTNIATAITTTTQTTPFTGIWDLPAFLAGTPFLNSISGSGAMNKTKTQIEAVPRQLASVTDTRCWNLLIDVITQTGRYPKTATNPGQFLVEGERRYWLHLAIDRRTGKIVDEQLEPVFE